MDHQFFASLACCNIALIVTIKMLHLESGVYGTVLPTNVWNSSRTSPNGRLMISSVSFSKREHLYEPFDFSYRRTIHKNFIAMLFQKRVNLRWSEQSKYYRNGSAFHLSVSVDKWDLNDSLLQWKTNTQEFSINSGNRSLQRQFEFFFGQ